MSTSPRQAPMSHALSLHKIEKLDLSSVPPVRTSAEEDVVLTSVLPTTWPSAAGDDEDQPSKHEDDIATARPSHRRLAGIHSKSLDLEKGHRVEVFVRLRPMLPQEKELYGQGVIVKVNEAKGLVRLHNRVGTRITIEDHQFDGAFGPTSSQLDVYNGAIRPLVQDVCNGLNTAAFVYGATGTGKTFTMVGDCRGGDGVGMIPRALKDVWETMRAVGRPFRISVSMVEIYNEKLQDMFVPATAEEPLKIMSDAFREGVFCQNLYEVEVRSPEQALQLLEFAEQRSKQQEMTANKMSSRAHRVFMLVNEFTSASGVKEIGRLSMIDMAGSESMANATVSMLADARRLETKSINQSMLTFGRVLIDLNKGSTHVPYRDSKLTRLVSEALGGYCRTAIITTVSPARTCEDETQSALSYGQMARRVYNKPQGSKLKRVMIELANTHEIYQRILEEDRAKMRQLMKANGPNKLNTVRMMRDILLAAHQRTEQQLGREAKTMRKSLQTCVKDVDELRSRVTALGSNASATRDAAEAAANTVHAHTTKARDQLFSAYNTTVSACTSLHDAVDSASNTVASQPVQADELVAAVADLAEVAAVPIQWPSLSKFNAETHRFSSEVSNFLADQRGIADSVQLAASSDLSEVVASVEASRASIARQLEAAQAAHADTMQRLCVGLEALESEYATALEAQERTIADLRAQVTTLSSSQHALADERVNALKTQFKAILVRQQQQEADRLEALEFTMLAKMQSLQAEVEDLRAKASSSVQQAASQQLQHTQLSASRASERVKVAEERALRLQSSLHAVPADITRVLASHHLKDVKAFFGAHCDSIMNQVSQNHVAIVEAGRASDAALTAAVISQQAAAATAADKEYAESTALAEAFGARLLDLCAAWAQARASVQSRAAELTRSATTDLQMEQKDVDATAAFEAMGPVCAPQAACLPVSYDSVLTQYDSSWVQHWAREVQDSKTLQALNQAWLHSAEDAGVTAGDGGEEKDTDPSQL